MVMATLSEAAHSSTHEEACVRVLARHNRHNTQSECGRHRERLPGVTAGKPKRSRGRKDGCKENKDARVSLSLCQVVRHSSRCACHAPCLLQQTIAGSDQLSVCVSRARVMSAAHRVAVLAAYRRALKIARDWPRLVGDLEKTAETTVAAQEYIRSEARQLIEHSGQEQNPHAINKCGDTCSHCATRCCCSRAPERLRGRPCKCEARTPTHCCP